MNDTHIDMHNPIFQTPHEFDDRQQHTQYPARYISKSKAHKKSIQSTQKERPVHTHTIERHTSEIHKYIR
jgi:hypothetical protein